MEILYAAIAAAVIGLLFALYLTLRILKEGQGNERVRFIGQAVQEGANAFLRREYTFLAIFVVVVVVIIAVFIDYDILGKVNLSEERNVPWTAIAYLVGACLLYTSPSPRDGLLSRMPSSA